MFCSLFYPFHIFFFTFIFTRTLPYRCLHPTPYLFSYLYLFFYIKRTFSVFPLCFFLHHFAPFFTFCPFTLLPLSLPLPLPSSRTSMPFPRRPIASGVVLPCSGKTSSSCEHQRAHCASSVARAHHYTRYCACLEHPTSCQTQTVRVSPEGSATCRKGATLFAALSTTMHVRSIRQRASSSSWAD